MKTKKKTPSSQVRTENQRRPMSTKTERLFHRYEEHLHVGYAERTVPEYLAHVRAFLDWLSGLGIELAEVRTEDLQTYQSELLAHRKKTGKAYSLGFQRNRLTALKNLFGFLFRSGCLLHDPSSTLSFPVKEKKLPRVVLTPKEVRRLIGRARKRTPAGLRDRALLETVYATGIRASELANLHLGDVDTEEMLLSVRLGKGRKDRSVPLLSAACEAVEAYLENGRAKLDVHHSSLLFLADKGGRLHRAVLSRIIARYAEKAGIEKHVTCHTFRHSVATHLLKGGADIRYIQKLLGHESLQTTERYTRVEISDLKRVIARAHPRA